MLYLQLQWLSVSRILLVHESFLNKQCLQENVYTESHYLYIFFIINADRKRTIKTRAVKIKYQRISHRTPGDLQTVRAGKLKFTIHIVPNSRNSTKPIYENFLRDMYLITMYRASRSALGSEPMGVTLPRGGGRVLNRNQSGRAAGTIRATSRNKFALDGVRIVTYPFIL